MAVELVYDFKVGGMVQGLHHDCFNLGFLGAQRIQRASDIRFDEGTQTWGIWLIHNGKEVPPTPALSGFAEYDEARRFEVAALNACRLAAVAAASEQAAAIIASMRGG